jgi:hypothetical protein
MNDAVQRMHQADTANPPYPGFDASQLPAWKQRELAEAQREADRQRALLAARQQEHPQGGTSTNP